MAETITTFTIAYKFISYWEPESALKPGSIPIRVEPVKSPTPIETPEPVKEPVKI